jgi:hypothetical protein
MNTLPSACRNLFAAGCTLKPGSRHTCRMHYARKGYSAVCTITPVKDTLQYVQLSVPSSLGQCICCAFRPYALYKLALSHQACDSRPSQQACNIFASAHSAYTACATIQPQACNSPDLKKLKNSSAHNIKTDHLVQQHFFFSVLAEGDAQMHAQISKTSRSAPTSARRFQPDTSRSALRARDHSNPMHSAPRRAYLSRSSHSSARTFHIAFCRIGAQTPWVFMSLQ